MQQQPYLDYLWSNPQLEQIISTLIGSPQDRNNINSFSKITELEEILKKIYHCLDFFTIIIKQETSNINVSLLIFLSSMNFFAMIRRPVLHFLNVIQHKLFLWFHRSSLRLYKMLFQHAKFQSFALNTNAKLNLFFRFVFKDKSNLNSSSKIFQTSSIFLNWIHCSTWQFITSFASIVKIYCWWRFPSQGWSFWFNSFIFIQMLDKWVFLNSTIKKRFFFDLESILCILQLVLLL